ncbi:protein NDR1 [Amborella trichopoda]|nr:protein NDR1 [Amborella trichopoda]|eukprot:XP_006855830.3 protein NDR1 [Amborella trichopoda]
MSSPAGLPQKMLEQPRPHRTRYYAHRVGETLTNRFFKFFCSCFLGLLLLVGVVAFVLWLSLSPHRPRFHMESFSIPGINQAIGSQNTVVNFNISARNPNQNIGIYYNAMEGTVFFRDQVIGRTPLISTFYQPPKNTTWIYGMLTSGGVSSTGMQEMIRQFTAGSVDFRVELTAMIRFKVTTWHGKNHRMHVSCDVALGQNGQILERSKERRCSLYFS